MCGAWHPVAQTTFSSHWNEQGISRFRAGIAMAAQFISHCLKLRMVPLATNLQLRCRELEGLLSVAKVEGVYESDNIIAAHKKVAGHLRRCSELLLYKLDDMSAEVDDANQGLLLFLQVSLAFCAVRLHISNVWVLIFFVSL